MATGPGRRVVGRSASEVAALVRQGTTSPIEVLREHLEQIERLDPRLGAFQVVRGGRALAEAEELAGRSDLAELPLAGVPIPIKDNIPVAGEPMRDGTMATPDTPSASDHELVRRLRAAGGIVIGLTRMPELGVFAATDGAFGVTRNPWDLDLTPGGSSGGAAAAVASAMAPVAQGSDGLGSIRIPSACCGLFGIKPGRGVVPADVGSTSWFGLSENGPMATTVDDAALVLSAMAGRPELRDVTLPATPLRVAISTRSPLAGVRIDRHYRQAVVETGRLLEGAGHRAVEADPPYSVRTASAVLAWWFVAVLAEVEGLGLDPAKLEPRIRRHASFGRVVRSLRLMKHEQRDRWRERVAAFFDRHDVLVTPALASPPLKAIEWSRRGWLSNVYSNAMHAPFPAPWNFAAYPAAAIPAGMHPAGVPLSIQLVAAEGGEARILSVARQLEELRPWPRHAPMAGLG
jgi:amidase